MIKIKVSNSLHESTDLKYNEISVDINSKKNYFNYDYKNKFAYSPFINAHDHLISNWFPRSGERGPYANSHIWVQENKQSDSFLERNKIWINDGDFDLTTGKAKQLALLGMYKNIFSGVHIVQDHIKQQKSEYYDYFDIHVIRNYSQCHSITLGNWWGGDSPEEEMKKSKGINPFIIHLSEGTDNTTKNEFNILLEKDLLHSNTLIIHGIALEKNDFQKIATEKASICWCPSSNMYLIGKTLDVMTAIECGVNITLGTDSTMTGGTNLFEEFKHAKRACNKVTAKQLYEMVTQKAETALLLYDKELLSAKKNLLILDKMHDDIYENILYQEIDNIDLLIHQSKPIYGNINYFEDFELDPQKYDFLKVGNKEKFIIGKPKLLVDEINELLGYKKNFPFMPF